jgi:CRISPR-associated exonuclease Cas4
MFNEDELLPISALQHLSFCERQYALIHIEQLWAENRLTVEGRLLHDRVHEADAETRSDVRIVRGLRLRSLRLGLAGVADVVEFHRSETAGSGARVERPFPVEYKRGKPKPEACDELQLCAQAMCLEEMLAVKVPAGALFYGLTRRRHDVSFDSILRAATERAARRLHELLDGRITPPAVYEKKCQQCSLLEACMPETTSGGRSTEAYLKEAVRGV